jgi:glycosyltransferase involved in cell wall biosynthesis
MTSGAPLRIVHICPRYLPAPGGVELFFGKLSTALVRAGHRVDVWTTTARSVDAFTSPGGATFPEGRTVEDGVGVFRYGLWHPPMRRYLLTAINPLPLGRAWRAVTLRWNPLPLQLVRDAMRASGPLDVVHAAGLPYSLFLDTAVRLARRTGARLVLTPFTHLGDPADRRNKIRRTYLSPLNVELLRAADVVLVQTGTERDALANAGIDPARMRLVGMGVDPAECTGGCRTRGRARWKLTSDQEVVGHLANKSADKGTIDLLEASARAWRDGARFRLLLAGEEMNSFRAFWRQFPFQDRVVNVGELSSEEKKDFFAAIDVFALPSYVESFGISLLEAACNRVPSVAYRLGGPAEVLEDGANGLLVPPGDIAALSRAIAGLLADAPRRARLGDAAGRLAAAWTWERVLDTVIPEYRSPDAPWSHEHRPHYCES